MTPVHTWKLGLVASPILGSAIAGIVSILRCAFEFSIINIGIYLLATSIILIPFLIKFIRNEEDIQDLA